MKKFIGIVIILLSISLIGVIMLRIWNIEIISIQNVVRSIATLVLLVIAIVILIIVYGTSFRNKDHVYNKKAGNQAHPKK